MRNSLLVIFALNACILFQISGATKVGNGDDGSDLEGWIEITDGPIVIARKKAVKRLEKLHIRGIPGLGTLIPEVANSKLYMAKKDVLVKSELDNSRFHSNISGRVYARTFCEAHAATRFFPIAKGLDEDQLISLHIHEGLHRALPESVHKNESVVSQLTLAITSPEASHDRVYTVASDLIPALPSRYSPSVTSNQTAAPSSVASSEEFENPSSVGYEYRQFVSPNRPTEYPIDRMHVIYSHLYPFGGKNSPFGMGIGLSLIDGPDNHKMGPLNVSGRIRLLSSQAFNVGLFAQASLNTLSDGELKNSPFGRDVFTFGLSLSRETKSIFVENSVSIAFGNDSTVEVGRIRYNYDYGKTIEAKLKAGLKLSDFRIGAHIQVHLADFLRVSGGNFQFDSGRYRLLSAGPELAYVTADYSFSIFGSALLDASNDANFDFLGNLLGPGTSQGSVGASVSLFF